MGGLGAHLSWLAQPSGHFLDEMRRGGDLGNLAWRNDEPGTGERPLDLCARHALCSHRTVPLAPAAELTQRPASPDAPQHSVSNRLAAEPRSLAPDSRCAARVWMGQSPEVESTNRSR